MMLLGGGFRVDQVGIVVSDLDQAVERYARTFSSGPWNIWTYGPEILSESRFRGEPGCYRMRLALSGADPQLELIQPLDGPSLYHEWLEERGEGLHHFGMKVGDLDAAIGDMEQRGYGVLMLGRGHGADGDGGFAYLDTMDDVGVILELIEVPRTRRPPEATVGGAD